MPATIYREHKQLVKTQVLNACWISMQCLTCEKKNIMIFVTINQFKSQTSGHKINHDRFIGHETVLLAIFFRIQKYKIP